MAKKVAYKSEKRKKELVRQKKQEEKRQRRLQKEADDKSVSEVTGQDEQKPAEG